MSKKQNRKSTKNAKAKKSGEALRREAIADADRNIAAIERGEKKSAFWGKDKPTEAHARAVARARQRDAAKNAGDMRLSALDAAAKVLSKSKKPMNCKQMIEAMREQKLWTSPGGKTPHATLNSAIQREIAGKGSTARFRKVGRGEFTAAT